MKNGLSIKLCQKHYYENIREINCKTPKHIAHLGAGPAFLISGGHYLEISFSDLRTQFLPLSYL